LVADACRAFDTPVTGGNVSLYNESPTGAVDPTPTVGMVGLLDDVRLHVPSHFRAPGDLIAVLGSTHGHLGGSYYWAVVRNFLGGPPPPCDLDAERRLQQLLVAAARVGVLRSAHDCADGGLAVALAEAAIGAPYAASPFGAGVHFAPPPDLALEGLLFGEDGARVVVSVAPGRADELRPRAAGPGVPFTVVGSVAAAVGAFRVTAGSTTFDWAGAELRQIYYEAIPRRMAARSPESEGAN
jgi:phosphoribosylformylglycinamidine synthase